MPASISGMQSSIPMVSAAPEKAELRVGLAEQFADDARDAIAEREGAGDDARPLERAGAHQHAETMNSTMPSSAAS